TTFDHAGQRGMRKLHQRKRIEDDFFALTLDRQCVKRTAGAESRAVAQARNRISADPLGELGSARLVGEIQWEHIDSQAVLVAQLVGDFNEPLATSCDEYQRVAAPGEAAGKFGADPRRRSGDHDDGVSAWL